MSTATKPFIRRGALLPFCADNSPLRPSPSNFDNVELDPDDEDEDEGFSRAMRLWWFLETYEITPTGTYTLGGASVSFTKSFPAFYPNTTDLDSYLVSGAIAGGIAYSTATQAPVEPIFRQCPGALARTSFIYDYEGTGAAEEFFSLLYVGYDGGKWRLYYQFRARFGGVGGVPFNIVLSNPAIVIGSPYETGTLSLFGIDLQWAAKLTGGGTATGIGMSGTSVYWTF